MELHVSIDRNDQFDILQWHPAYQNCQRFFLDHGQHEEAIQAVAALINIQLPYQWSINPVWTSGQCIGSMDADSTMNIAPRNDMSITSDSSPVPRFVSLLPYLRRLVVTGFDKAGVLQGFFGEAWRAGIEPLQECERRNYLFTAKSGGWLKAKNQYDISPQETVPFMKPLQNAELTEIKSAERNWSQWLAMEDWMLGPRAPPNARSSS